MKPLLVLVGVGTAVFARSIVDACEPLAFENPDELSRRWTTLPAARAEGLAAVAIGLYGRWPASLSTLFGLAGVVLALAPRRVLDVALAIAYRNPGRIEPKPWVLPVTRLVGLVHLLFALSIRRRRRDGR